MTISDVIFETANDLIEGVIGYYDRDSYHEIAEEEDVVEVIAVHLKVDSRRSYHRPTEADLARINAIDWRDEAKKFIDRYIRQNFLTDDEDEVEEPVIKPVGLMSAKRSIMPKLVRR